MHRSLTSRSVAALAVAVIGLTGCAGDDPADVVEGAEDTVEDVAEDMEDVADDAAEVLEDAGIDVNEEGSATVSFGGETITVPADDSFGCFIIEDGGSQGAVSFNGQTDDGFVLAVDWSGDSPEFGYVDMDFPDGTLWRKAADTELDVAIDGSSATVTSTVVQVGNVDETAEVTVEASCG